MTVTKRGRPSLGDLTTLTPMGAVERLSPPLDYKLTDEETVVWFGVVNAEAADWFSSSTAPLLAQYCRHVVEARRVSELKEQAFARRDFAAYDRLLQAQARESAAIAMLATKMRIAQQSTTNHRGNAKKPTQARKLWE